MQAVLYGSKLYWVLLCGANYCASLPFLKANDRRLHLIFANGGYTLLLKNNTSRL